PIKRQRNMVPLENPAVLEREDVEAVGLGRGIPLFDAIDEEFRIHELVLHVLDQAAATGGVVIGGDERCRNAPHFLEVSIVRDDLAAQVDDENAVGGGFQRRL